ncbi:nucleoside triphosphate pyrophosphohydrolase [Alicyclobacillus curvatus]|nr:nucleoside triphosphate pyrophosphohydrolase [Alicyclobacillus curvatus]
MPTYNKLVRDRIPEIIGLEGKNYTVRTLSDEEYAKELKVKLSEELREYLETQSDVDAVEELADIVEIIHALCTVHGSSAKALEGVRQAKAEKRGGFQEKIFLIEVKD